MVSGYSNFPVHLGDVNPFISGYSKTLYCCPKKLENFINNFKQPCYIKANLLEMSEWTGVITLKPTSTDGVSYETMVESVGGARFILQINIRTGKIVIILGG